jgi:branched-chain amino acid transport system substrate-binding protein
MRNIHFIVLAFFTAIGIAAPAHAADAIKFGAGLPLSGGTASYGEDIKAGIDLSAADINAKGGVLGKKIEVTYGDTACDPKNAVAVANRFVTMGVDVTTDVCSTACLAEGPIYNEENIPFITACSSEQVTAKGWKNLFRAYPGNNQESPKLIELIKRLSAGKKLALVYDNQEYDVNLEKSITTALAAAKTDPAAIYSIVGDPNDYSSYITKLKEQQVDVVFVGMFPKAMGLFLRQAAEANYHPQFIGTLMTTTDDVHKIAGDDAMKGMIITNTPDPKNIPAAQPIIKALASRGVIDRPFSVYAYILLQIYSEAVEKAGSTDKAAVIKTLKSATLPTILGPVSFAPAGDMNGLDFEYQQWQQGHWLPFDPH